MDTEDRGQTDVSVSSVHKMHVLCIQRTLASCDMYKTLVLICLQLEWLEEDEGDDARQEEEENVVHTHI